MPILPPSWLSQCPELTEYESGLLEEIARVHGQNAKKYGVCRVYHNALVERLKEVQADCAARIDDLITRFEAHDAKAHHWNPTE